MSCRFLQNSFLHNSTDSNQEKSEIEKIWLSRLSEDYLEQSQQEKDSIIQWLLGEEQEVWNSLTREQQKINQQSLNNRYQILKLRYLNVTATQAYRNLINRLGSVVVEQQNLKNWITANRNGQRALLEVVQEVIQEMLKSDRYLLQQMSWIAQCTCNEMLRDRLLLASVEEYCLKSIQNQSLFIDRLFNYIHRNPNNKSVLLLLEPMNLDDYNIAMVKTKNQNLEQFTKVMLEVRYPISA
ncbi:hypothetical protein C7H19_05255 [Aphanothece hegewaldii CCALA 016]|uniref:Uncharacterized protein n=2 Tax=Aphanothece TaxID=1121 RepID=A0A2T1M149_9CHRO|nr:hypothetical protein C7H19_05255 [Aphanothece hegewaldii CCALA 016]